MAEVANPDRVKVEERLFIGYEMFGRVSAGPEELAAMDKRWVPREAYDELEERVYSLERYLEQLESRLLDCEK